MSLELYGPLTAPQRDKHASVFEPFVQIDTTVLGRSAGAGLGLTISKRLAQGMEGTLRVRGEPGVGSSFTLALRRARDGPSQR
jgi:signal transduction histidine kinase